MQLFKASSSVSQRAIVQACTVLTIVSLVITLGLVVGRSESPQVVCEISQKFRASAQCIDFDRFGDIV